MTTNIMPLSPARPLDVKEEGGDVTRAGGLRRRMPGVALLTGGLALAAALFLTPDAARAQNECGTNSGSALECADSGTAYTDGIVYDAQANSITLTVTGGTATTITASTGAANSRDSGIYLRTASGGSTARNISLTVGTGSNGVVINQGSSPDSNDGEKNHGIRVYQGNANTSTTAVTVSSSVTIGASGSPMMDSGIKVHMVAGSGDGSVTNQGTIFSTDDAIRIDHLSAGAFTVTNSGSLTSEGIANNQHGIYAQAEADGAFTVTHSAGTISTAGGDGVHVYFAGGTTAKGLVKIEITGGSVAAKDTAIKIDGAGQYGSAEVNIASGVTVTAADAGEAGISVGLTHASASGSISITNAAAITAGSTSNTGGHGIYARRDAGSGAVTVDNSGDIRTFGGGEGIRLDIRGTGGGAVSVTNRGDITAGDERGINIDDRSDTGQVNVVSSGDITSRREAIQVYSGGKDNADGMDDGISITHSAGALSAKGRSRQGIKGLLGNSGSASDFPTNTGTVTISVTGGSVDADRSAIEAINNHGGSVVVAVGATTDTGNVDFTLASGVTLTSEADHGIKALLPNPNNPSGSISVTNAAAITAGSTANTGQRHGIYAERTGKGSGAVTVRNSGAIRTLVQEDSATGTGYGIYAKAGDAGTISVTTSGALSVTNRGALGTADNRVSLGIYALSEAPSGNVSVTNSGDVMATGYGIHAKHSGATGIVSVTHSAGTVSAQTESGIRAENTNASVDNVAVAVTGGSVMSQGQSKPAVQVRQNGTGSIGANISSGAMLTSKHNAGIYANLDNASNRFGVIGISQGGTIAGRKGIYARFRHPSAMGAERQESQQPAIDIRWTGAFSHGTTATVAGNDNDRFLARDVAHAVAIAQEVETEKAMRYGSAAGIEAQVMSWRDVMTAVAKGDDPDVIADAAATLADATSGPAIRAAFRAVLTNPEIDTIPGVDAIEMDDGTAGLSDDDIDTYLTANPDILRNVLAQGLSDEEKAVLRAVATNEGLDVALDNEDAGFSDDYKTAVRAFLDRHNVGDIRIAVNGGSIDSRGTGAGGMPGERGDGIRAYYATPNPMNGAISVSVAEGATVTGGMAGIYVANAGMGTVSASTPTWGEALYLKEEDTPLTLRQQFVRVGGTVTGGTDAAVHLSGGGVLLVEEGGNVNAGASGRAILVNDHGPSELVIHGTVKGGSGTTAAIETMGGGRIILGREGRVDLTQGAKSIRATDGNTEVVFLVLENDQAENRVSQEDAHDAWENLGGANSFTADSEFASTVIVRATDEDGLLTGMREAGTISIGADGNSMLDISGIPDVPRMPPPPTVTTVTVTLPGKPTTVTTVTTVTATVPTPTPTPTPTPGPGPGIAPMDCDGVDDMYKRCRLYEALPSALLAMNGLPTYAERMSAARDGRGGWLQVETAGGKWKADSSTRPDVAYDHRRYGVRAGMDVAVDGNVRLGASVHSLRGSADMTQNGGEADLSGVGLGVHATTMAGDVYIDAQAAATRYEVDLTSAMGAKLKDGAKGTGYALAVEVGRAMAMGGELSVTPRAGLAYSRAPLGDFTDELGTRVSMEDAKSTKGRVGLMVETAVGSEDAPGRVFGSVDVEHEFKDETSVNVMADDLLKSTARATGVRLGLGGDLSVGEDVVLRARANYTRRGGDTNEFGGGLELNMRF